MVLYIRPQATQIMRVATELPGLRGAGENQLPKKANLGDMTRLAELKAMPLLTGNWVQGVKV